MTIPLKIEVTEAMRMVAFRVLDDPHNQWHTRDERITAALTAAFQHPEFRRQFLAQVVAEVPANMNPKNIGIKLRHGEDWVQGWNEANDSARASLGRLLGEES